MNSFLRNDLPFIKNSYYMKKLTLVLSAWVILSHSVDYVYSEKRPDSTRVNRITKPKLTP